MKQREKKLTVLALAAAASLFTGVIAAQDSADPAATADPAAATTDAAAPSDGATTDAAATDAAATNTTSTDSASTETSSDSSSETASAEEAPAGPPVKPRPSELLPLSTKGLLLDVASSGKHLFAVGDRGVILVSNNGKDWAQVVAPVRSALTAVSFADETVGWAVGHDATILKTADGGQTWTMQKFEPTLEKPLLDVIALDANNAIAVGAYGLMFATTDGGTTWNDVNAPSIRADEFHFNAISKLANGALLVVGEQGTIGLSGDNGATWEKLASPYEGSFYGAIPSGDAGAYIFGLRGNLYQATALQASAAAAAPVDPTADPAAAVDPAAAPEPAPVADAAAATDTAATDAAAVEGGDVAAAPAGPSPFTQVNSNTVASFFSATATSDGAVVLAGLSGTLIKLDSSGGTKQLKVKITELDGYGKEQQKDVTGTFSSVLAFGGGLVVVGEQGVQSVKLN